MPPNHKLIRKHVLIIKGLHESAHKLLLGRVSLHEIQHHSLHQPLDSDFTVSFNQAEESGLVLSPVLYDVALLGKYSREENKVLILGSDVHDELGLPYLGQQLID